MQPHASRIFQKQEELVKMRKRCQKATHVVPQPYSYAKSPAARTIRSRPLAPPLPNKRDLPNKLPQVLQVSRAALNPRRFPVQSRYAAPTKTIVPVEKENMHACLKPSLPLKKVLRVSPVPSRVASRPGSARLPVTPPRKRENMKYEEGKSTMEVLEKALGCNLKFRRDRYLAKATIF